MFLAEEYRESRKRPTKTKKVIPVTFTVIIIIFFLIVPWMEPWMDAVDGPWILWIDTVDGPWCGRFGTEKTINRRPIDRELQKI